MKMGMAKRRRLLLPRAGTTAVLLMMGCSGEGGAEPDTRGTTTSTEVVTEPTAPHGTTEPESESSSTTTTSTTSSSPKADDGTSAAEQEVVDRYLGFWRARWAANAGIPDPAHPDLAEFATGEQLDAVVAETKLNLERGLSFRAADEPVDFQRVQVLTFEADRAVVQECVVDDGLIVRTDSGEVVDQDVTTQNARGELVRGDDGRWRVSRVQVIQMWEGVAGCASGS